MIQGITQYKQIIQKAKGRHCRTPPRTLHVLSWNCNGGNKAVLDAFIGTYKPDLVILQECNAQWYTTAPQGYSGQTISERHVWPLTGGQLVSDGNSSYCVLYTGLQVIDNLQVLDYRRQARANPNYVALFAVPPDIGRATSAGFAARIPAIMRFRNPHTMSEITLFNWHAHTSQDGIQAASFRFLEMSVELRMAVNEAGPQDLVIIAGDLNNDQISGLGTLTGIDQKFDHIFANSGVHPYTDVVMETARIALTTSSGDHTAIGGFIDY